MYKLQRYSSVLLVLLLHIKTLTGLPYEVQPVPVAQPPQPVNPAANPSPVNNVPALDAPVETRSLNVSNSNPSLRSALEATAVNVSLDVAPVARALPAGLPNQPQQEDVAARSAFSSEKLPSPPPNGVVASNADADGAELVEARFNSATLNANLSVSPSFRSGLEGLTSNVSNIEQRSLNLSSSPLVEVAPKIANNSQVAARSLNSPPPVSVSNGGTFVPSFLRSFSLRRKRGEEDAHIPGPDSLEQAAPVESGAEVAEVAVKNLEQASPVSNNDAAAAVAPQLNAKVEPTDANVRSRLDLASVDPAASFAVNVPYINVYPVAHLEV